MNKKALMILGITALCPLAANATDVNIDLDGVRIQSGNTSITFGSRDKRGYYWDGSTWRDPVYWNSHQDQYKSKGHGKDYHCPPGQAKKGKC